MNRYYDPEFKKEAVELIYSTGKSIKQIAREIGCSSSSLGEWKRNYEQDNSASEISSQPANLQQLHQHIKQLEKELKRVKEEREILKKAAGILGN